MIEKAAEALKKNHFEVVCFKTAKEAAEYLNSVIDSTTVGIGGSHTILDMNLAPMLEAHNLVYFISDSSLTGAKRDLIRKISIHTDVYITSANALVEGTGEIVNIDATGNRAAATLFGHRKVYFVIGKNKIVPSLDQAIWRARNIAAPKNCQALGKKTPCAVTGDQCYDCDSPDRICNGLVVLWKKMNGCDMEVVLVNENLGY